MNRRNLFQTPRQLFLKNWISCKKLLSLYQTFSFWHQIVSSFFCCYKFNVPIFLMIFQFFQKMKTACHFEKFFSKSFSATFLKSLFVSTYGFRHTFWFNLLTLCTFFNTSPCVKACIQFLISIMYSVLSCKLATSFSTFSIFIFPSRNG